EGFWVVWRTYVHHPSGFEPLDVEGHSLPVLRDLGVDDVEDLFTDLRTAIRRGRNVTPLRDVVGVRDVLHSRIRERVSIGDFESLISQTHLVHVEGAVRNWFEFL